MVPRLSKVEIRRGCVIRPSGERVSWVHFPIRGLVSVVGRDGEGEGADVAVVGRDGILDVHAALVDLPMPTEALQQIPGAAFRMPVADFRQAVRTLPGLRQAIDRYVAVLFVEVAQGSACNRLHELQARIARWLLLTSDHVGDESFALTHELLALMVGSSRPKVTQRLRSLADAGTLSLGRNEIGIVDRAALGTYACGCYAVISEARAHVFEVALNADPAARANAASRGRLERR